MVCDCRLVLLCCGGSAVTDYAISLNHVIDWDFWWSTEKATSCIDGSGKRYTSGKNKTSRWIETRGPTNFHTSMIAYCLPQWHLVDSCFDYMIHPFLISSRNSWLIAWLIDSIDVMCVKCAVDSIVCGRHSQVEVILRWYYCWTTESSQQLQVCQAGFFSLHSLFSQTPFLPTMSTNFCTAGHTLNIFLGSEFQKDWLKNVGVMGESKFWPYNWLGTSLMQHFVVPQSHRGCNHTVTSFWIKLQEIALRSQYGHSVVVVSRTGRWKSLRNFELFRIPRWLLGDFSIAVHSVCCRSVLVCGRSTIIHDRAATALGLHSIYGRTSVLRLRLHSL